MKSPRHRAPADASPPVAPGAPGYKPTPSPAPHRQKRGLDVRFIEQSWRRLFMTLAFGGFVYPASVLVVLSPFLAFAALGLVADGGGAELMTAFFTAAVFLTFVAAFFGLLILVVSPPVIGGVLIVNRAFGWRPTWPALGTICGASVAFVLTLPFALAIAHEVLQNLAQPGALPAYMLGPVRGFILWGLGPGLACIVGQVLGAWAGCANDSFERFKQSAAKAGSPAPAVQRRTQVSIRQLLVLTAVVALVLAALRSLDLLTYATFLTLAMGIAWLVLMHRPAIRFGRWLLKKRRRKRGDTWGMTSTPTSPRLDRPGYTGDPATDIAEYWRLHDDQMNDYRRRTGESPPQDRST